MESIDLASLVCLRRSIADCICGSCASLTLVYVQFKFCSSVIYFIKRSRNFGFAGQCFKSSFLFLFVPRTYLPFHFFFFFSCFFSLLSFIFHPRLFSIFHHFFFFFCFFKLFSIRSFVLKTHNFVILFVKRSNACIFISGYNLNVKIRPETAIKHSPVDLSSLEIWHSRIQFTFFFFFFNTHVYISVMTYWISIFFFSRRKYTWFVNLFSLSR